MALEAPKTQTRFEGFFSRINMQDFVTEGFADPRLNGMWHLADVDPFRINDCGTYWTSGGDFFIYLQIFTGMWAIVPTLHPKGSQTLEDVRCGINLGIAVQQYDGRWLEHSNGQWYLSSARVLSVKHLPAVPPVTHPTIDHATTHPSAPEIKAQGVAGARQSGEEGTPPPPPPPRSKSDDVVVRSVSAHKAALERCGASAVAQLSVLSELSKLGRVVTIKVLQATSVGKVVAGLARQSSDADIRRVAQGLTKIWRSMAQKQLRLRKRDDMLRATLKR